MKGIVRRIEDLERRMGCAPETPFDRLQRARLEEGLKRVRQLREERGEADEEPEEELLFNGRRPRTVPEILMAGRERARLRAIAEDERRNQIDPTSDARPEPNLELDPGL
jgi:hypothetical protein